MQRSWLVALLAGVGFGMWQVAARPRPIDLRGNVVIITGASAGIGRATARAFAAQGASVVLVARRADVLAEVAAELTHDFAVHPETLLCIPADVTSAADLPRIIADTLHHFGRIDVLVNNAGLSLGGPLESQAESALRRLIDVNIYGPLRLTQLALPIMLKQRSGHIVNVSSMMGVLEPPGATTYTATRSAIRGFSRALRREVAGTGVHVSTVFPGWTKTAMTDKLNLAQLHAAGLLGPLITVDDAAKPAQAIVDAVRFRRDEVLLGGLHMTIGGRLVGLSSKLTDLYYRWFVNRAAALEAMRDLGA
ncbi:MAG: SDR family NAD(P)-dependent oxidoreductase [Thermoflexales bacterium]|nr:SDR family NAD(P)-dependent oxidoreductase [Thermoflexales bacterium]